MRHSKRFLAAVAVVLLATGAAVTSDDRNARIGQELDRLEATLSAIDPNDLPKEMGDAIGDQRKAIERARKITDPDYRLYRTRDPFIGVETLAFLAKEKKSGESVETFEKLWTAKKARFEAKLVTPKGSHLQRGLAESAATRAGRYYRASLPYAKASAPWSGVYYLGEAEGNLRFHDFLKSIAADTSEKGSTKGRIAASLQQLESDALKFFGNDVTNQGMIAVSVRLKEARELLDANRVDGAALLLTEARAAFSRRGGPKGSYPAEASNAAGSIRKMVEAWSEEEQSPMKEALREEVIPFYGSLLLPAPAATKTAGDVTVTLVRWPYT